MKGVGPPEQGILGNVDEIVEVEPASDAKAVDKEGEGEEQERLGFFVPERMTRGGELSFDDWFWGSGFDRTHLPERRFSIHV